MSTANEPSLPVPVDFEHRCSATYARLKAGETMTPTQIAEALGLPVQFFAAAMAVYCALTSRRPVIVDPTTEPSKLH